MYTIKVNRIDEWETDEKFVKNPDEVQGIFLDENKFKDQKNIQNVFQNFYKLNFDEQYAYLKHQFEILDTMSSQNMGLIIDNIFTNNVEAKFIYRNEELFLEIINIIPFLFEFMVDLTEFDIVRSNISQVQKKNLQLNFKVPENTSVSQ